MNNRTPVNTTAVAVALISLVGIVVLSIIGLVALGRQIDQVVYTLIGPALVSLVGFIGVLLNQSRVADKVDQLERKTDTVVQATNGKLDARFGEVHERLDQLGAPASSTITKSD